MEPGLELGLSLSLGLYLSKDLYLEAGPEPRLAPVLLRLGLNLGLELGQGVVLGLNLGLELGQGLVLGLGLWFWCLGSEINGFQGGSAKWRQVGRATEPPPRPSGGQFWRWSREGCGGGLPPALPG